MLTELAVCILLPVSTELKFVKYRKKGRFSETVTFSTISRFFREKSRIGSILEQINGTFCLKECVDVAGE